MAASDHLNRQQLQMFMPAGEIVATHGSSEAVGKETTESVMKRKQRENKTRGFGLDRTIAREGVQRPITIDHLPEDFNMPPEVKDGHHRLAAAYSHDPKTEVPVQHIDGTNFQQIGEHLGGHTWWSFDAERRGR